jgi:hypothetical protein
MSSFHYDEETVMNMLEQISKDYPELSWSKRVSYSNGAELTYHRITFFVKATNTVLEIITYRSDSGKILSLKRPYFRKPEPQNIIDALLEIMNKRKDEQM